MNALSKDMSGPLALFANRLNTLAGAERQSAAGALARTGLPDRKVEAWHYTTLRALGKQDYAAPPMQVEASTVRSLLDGVLQAHPAMAALPRVVFVNGRHAPAFSALPDDVDLSFFADDPQFGQQAAPDRDPLVALNTALAEDGLVLRVPAGVDAGHVMLISLGVAGADPLSFHPRHTVVVEKEAHLRLICVQAGQGAYFHNPVTDIQVEDGATLEHLTLQTEGAQAVSLGTLYAHVGQQSVYDSFVLGLGGQLVRHEVHARLAATRGVVHVNGAQRLAGQQVGDITSVITHAASDCTSRQTVRNVLDGHARGVFQGKVLVERIAQKTDGYQMNQALLLSPEAEIDAKPELEIYADDVRCSHGATVGALDDDQLFYLRSRGIPEQEARQMLIDAFLDEAIALVEDATAQTFCRAVMAARFAGKGESA
ncbi:MAG: Fe-S cluster assembly protein SufD [Acetobacter fabarum]|nr:Fe-S cluster assembly protein SufD [Acetobacter fabarum]MCH4026316.1 Fe-S cluster assembly protein SufD [Acetobacter fabarum]MCH4085822.1 Fe-S cluster assembly protein SufD [Acetobacter fabarum]MCH4127586.1 Fe-S cluster assembly protein SufD [Acetobacter fabarum]MCH4136935.1 Fe-S cluster assembly protein SufD [Acetobacter fabarum]MCH4140797.1 Fe-S cluster assembly protein SufD [Acetobacter fabarum]